MISVVCVLDFILMRKLTILNIQPPQYRKAFFLKIFNTAGA